MSAYIFDLEPDDNGTYLATSKAFPEIATYVGEPGELFWTGVRAIEEAIAARMADGRAIPAPATSAELVDVKPRDDGSVRMAWVKLPHLTTLKLLLHEALRDQGLTRAELQRRLDCSRESVDRLFRFDHLSKAGQIEEALLALGLEIVVSTGVAAPERTNSVGRRLKALRSTRRTAAA